jgi:hypothetical protein
MNMKDHMLAALREQFARWDALLASLSDTEIVAPRFDANWSIKDIMVHLWAWQQLSVARMEAAAADRELTLPAWVGELGDGWEEDADRTNAWAYATHHDTPWPEIDRQWRAGFVRFIETGAAIAEKDLLDSGRYPWMGGYPLANSLLASYDHHQEHLEKLLVSLSPGGAGPR